MKLIKKIQDWSDAVSMLVLKQLSICVLLLILLSSCRKLVTVDGPDTSISSEDIFKSDATATAVLTGLYTNLSGRSFISGGLSISLFGGLSADELSLYPGYANESFGRYYKNALSTSPQIDPDFWNNIYPSVYITNAAILGITASNSLTPKIKNQLLGEAKFMRAFYYFYLVNLYGDVPLVTGTDYTINSQLARSPESTVWDLIIKDLKEAQVLLSANYLDGSVTNGTEDRVRPTKWAATALLSRAFLYTQKYGDAERESSLLIENNALFDTVSVENVFMKNNREAIWQLQPVASGFNTLDAMTFVLPESGPDAFGFPVYLNSSLVSSFELDDKRQSKWIGSVTAGGKPYHFSYKYKLNNFSANTPPQEFTTVFRLGEQYLIRSEARLKLNDLSGAAADLNVIRKRAGLENISLSSNDEFLDAIMHERRLELFTEFGHRWLDMKRTGKIDAIMDIETPKKGGGIWNSIQKLYPIPLNDILKDHQLVQNPGYTQ